MEDLCGVCVAPLGLWAALGVGRGAVTVTPQPRAEA